MEESNTTKSQTFIDQLIEGDILSVEAAQLKIASMLSHDATVDVLTEAIRMKITDDQISTFLTDYESQRLQNDKAWEEGFRNAGEDERDFLLELESMSPEFVYSSECDISTPEFWLRKVLSLLSTKEQLSMSNRIVNANAILSHLCNGIDDLNLCESLKSQFLELSSKSLFALSSHSNRQRLSESEERQLTIEYAETGQTNAVAQIICDLIAHEGNANRFRKMCEYYLQRGINSEEKQYLRNRELMPGAERDVWQDLWNNFYFAYGFYSPIASDESDPAIYRPWEEKSDPRSIFYRTTIEFQNSLETVETPPARLDDIYETTIMPFQGSPTSLDRLSPFECLESLHDAGLLNPVEMRGFAVRFIEAEEERLNTVLCQHFDSLDRFSNFDAYLKATCESDRTEWRITGF